MTNESTATSKSATGVAKSAIVATGISVIDKRAGWWRRAGRTARTFHYETADGKKIANQVDLERIRALVIPPAWTNVRIATQTGARVQAVGIDAAGRVQRIYHQKFAAQRQRKKFDKVTRFGAHLPKLRSATNQHLALEGLTKERVLAVVVRLINELYFRVGSEMSVERYRTYGATTLRNRHVDIKRGKLEFNFVGKHHIRHRRVLVDDELATLLCDIKALKGARLFNYLTEDGRICPVKPQDVNEYIKTATDQEFTAKDFRTWGGTLLGAVALAEMGAPENEREAKRNVVRAVEQVAEHLGNTPAVCRGSYIHPSVIDSYLKGVTLEQFSPRKGRRINRSQPDALPEETALLKMLGG